MILGGVVAAWVLVLAWMASERRRRARRRAWDRDRERRAEALAARSLRPYRGHVEAAPIEPPIAWETQAWDGNGNRERTSE